MATNKLDEGENFRFDGAWVVDSLHLQMLKEIYAEEFQGKRIDRAFQSRRQIYASIIIQLSESELDRLDEKGLRDLIETCSVERLLPTGFSGMDAGQRASCLDGLLAEYYRVLDDWADPPVERQTRRVIEKMIRRMFARDEIV